MIRDVRLKYSSSLNSGIELETQIGDFKSSLTIKPVFKEDCVIEQLELDIEFESEIVKWRDFDYNWRKTNKRLIANYYSPKCLILDNGFKVMAGQTTGVWEFNPSYPTKLRWILINKWLTPLCEYDSNNNTVWKESSHHIITPIVLTILFTKDKVIEFSRSKKPFSAILSFTDHCDFDTLKLVQKQRELFKKNNIVTTKGIFPIHFSKRKENTSWECNQDEYKQWKADGHELCYHSLSQSLRKTRSEGIADFFQYDNHKLDFSTWIDHGFQPYNLTKFNSNEVELHKWVGKMNALGIKNMWNYTDSGTSGGAIINQIDYNSFLLSSYLKASKTMRFFDGTYFLIRSYHLYFASQLSNHRYLVFVKELKQRSFKKGFLSILHFIKVSLVFSWSLFCMYVNTIPVFIYWNRIKNRVAPWGRFAPIIFKVNINNNIFNLFQTVEVHDFVNTFSIENVNKLIEQKGMCLAHTYFASIDGRQKGRIFKNSSGSYSLGIEEVFSNLNKRAKKEEIWISKITDVVDYFNLFNSIEYDIDKQGYIYLKSNNHDHLLHFRFVD